MKEDFEAMLRMKQDDWIKVCQEVDRLKLDLAGRGWISVAENPPRDGELVTAASFGYMSSGGHKSEKLSLGYAETCRYFKDPLGGKNFLWDWMRQPNYYMRLPPPPEALHNKPSEKCLDCGGRGIERCKPSALDSYPAILPVKTCMVCGNTHDPLERHVCPKCNTCGGTGLKPPPTHEEVSRTTVEDKAVAKLTDGLVAEVVLGWVPVREGWWKGPGGLGHGTSSPPKFTTDIRIIMEEIEKHGLCMSLLSIELEGQPGYSASVWHIGGQAGQGMNEDATLALCTALVEHVLEGY